MNPPHLTFTWAAFSQSDRYNSSSPPRLSALNIQTHSKQPKDSAITANMRFTILLTLFFAIMAFSAALPESADNLPDCGAIDLVSKEIFKIYTKGSCTKIPAPTSMYHVKKACHCSFWRYVLRVSDISLSFRKTMRCLEKQEC